MSSPSGSDPGQGGALPPSLAENHLRATGGEHFGVSPDLALIEGLGGAGVAVVLRDSDVVGRSRLERLAEGPEPDHDVVDGVFAEIIASFYEGDQEPLLNGRRVDRVAAIMVSAAAQLKLLPQAELLAEGGQPEATVEIDLEAARAKPGLIIDMIRSAPLTEFHEMILQADVAKFERDFARYHVEAKKGIWKSLELDRHEVNAAITLGGTKRSAKRDNRSEINSLWLRDDNPRPHRPLQGVYEYILHLDQEYKDGQPGGLEGRGSVRSAPKTRERLERLMAVMFGIRTGEGVAVQSPSEVGAAFIDTLMSREEAPEIADIEQNHPELLKLVGLDHELDSLWADLDQQHLIKHPEAHIAGERPTEVPDEIKELEALRSAILAKAVQVVGNIDGEALTMRLVSTIGGMEIIEGQRKEIAELQGDISGFLGIDRDNYSQENFRRDIRIAGAVRRVIEKFQGRKGVAEFEVRVLALFDDRLAKSGGTDEQQVTARLYPEVGHVLSAEVRFALSDEAYVRMAELALEQLVTEGGATHRADPLAACWHKQTLAATAARQIPGGERYEEAERWAAGDLGRAQQAEDFPGEGRALFFYGSVNTDEGNYGALEAIAIDSGGFAHLDSVGYSPLRDSQFRAQLLSFAEQKSIPVQIHEPTPSLPPNYQCEIAHYIGRMPRHFTPAHVLEPVIANGLATLSVESNPELVKQIKSLAGRGFDFREVPTELVRFLHSGGEDPPYQLGHVDPAQNQQEHTLVIFMYKDKTKTQSDLYRILRPAQHQDTQALTHRTQSEI